MHSFWPAYMTRYGFICVCNSKLCDSQQPFEETSDKKVTSV